VTRAAAIAWLLAGTLTFAFIIYAALVPGQSCVSDGAGGWDCTPLYTPAGVIVQVLLLSLLWPISPTLLFAWLIGVRKSRIGAIIAAVLGILAGVWLGATGLLYGLAASYDAGSGTVALTIAAAIVFGAIIASPGVLSALAAREIGRRRAAAQAVEAGRAGLA
jgi:hypothetical protein